MINSIYLNKTGMIIQQRRLDVSTNNLANINTVGHKKDGVFFHKLKRLPILAKPMPIGCPAAPTWISASEPCNAPIIRWMSPSTAKVFL